MRKILITMAAVAATVSMTAGKSPGCTVTPAPGGGLAAVPATPESGGVATPSSEESQLPWPRKIDLGPSGCVPVSYSLVHNGHEVRGTVTVKCSPHITHYTAVLIIQQAPYYASSRFRYNGDGRKVKVPTTWSSSAPHVSITPPAAGVTTYHKSVKCRRGRWRIRFHVAGLAEGVPFAYTGYTNPYKSIANCLG